MKYIVKAGTTSRDVPIFIQNSSVSTGAGLTGLVFNSAGLTAYYYRQGASSATAITLATATLGTWASGGFKEVDATNMPGMYTLGVPDAALASGATFVTIVLKGATNMAPVAFEIQLVAYDPQDTVRLGLTALPNVVAAGNGGLPTVDASNAVKVQSGTGSNQISLSSGTVTLTDGSWTAAKIASDAITAAKIATGAITAAKFAAGAIDAASIATDAIAAAKIASGAITSAKFAASAIDATAIAANAITDTKIASGAITSAKFAAGAIDASAIGADAITAAKIADGAIDAATFAAGAINAAAIATDAITAAKIAADAIGASELAADAVTEIQSGLATASSISALNNISTAQVNAEVDTALADYDGPTKAEMDSALAALNDITVADILAATIEGSLDVKESLRLALATLVGKSSGGSTTTITFRDTGDSKDRVVATVDSNGNRSAVTLDVTD